MAIGQMSETSRSPRWCRPSTPLTPASATPSAAPRFALPLEARNVVGLLSLQPGAVYLPHTANTDPRSGSVSGSRADQSNVTLDGVDVNDPQFGTAYTSALRVTTDALQEFRVATSNYGADTGRSSAAQVSLVTKSGTNMFHGSGTYTERDTKFSSKEYFLGLSGRTRRNSTRRSAAARSANTSRRTSCSSSATERLQGSSESRSTGRCRLTRCATACSFMVVGRFRSPGRRARLQRARTRCCGVLRSRTRALTAIDPLHLGPSKLVSDIFNKCLNDPGLDGYNIVGFRFASPIENEFNTPTSRVIPRHAVAEPVRAFNFSTTRPYPQQSRRAPGNTNKVGSRNATATTGSRSNKVNIPSRLHECRGLDGLRAAPREFPLHRRYQRPDGDLGRQTPTHNFVDDFSGSRATTREVRRTCGSRACLATTTPSRSAPAPRTRRGWTGWADIIRQATRARAPGGLRSSGGRQGFQAPSVRSCSASSETDLSANNVDGSVLGGDPGTKCGSDDMFMQDS